MNGSRCALFDKLNIVEGTRFTAASAHYKGVGEPVTWNGTEEHKVSPGQVS